MPRKKTRSQINRENGAKGYKLDANAAEKAGLRSAMIFMKLDLEEQERIKQRRLAGLIAWHKSQGHKVKAKKK